MGHLMKRQALAVIDLGDVWLSDGAQAIAGGHDNSLLILLQVGGGSSTARTISEIFWFGIPQSGDAVHHKKPRVMSMVQSKARMGWCAKEARWA